MSTQFIFILGVGVFFLLLTGLYLSVVEFLRHSDRPDIRKGVAPVNVVDMEQKVRASQN